MIQVTSFLLGIAAAWAIPTLGRVIRPLVVEAAVAGMSMLDEGKRMMAEQMETIEDMAAEARARREQTLAASNGHYADDGMADDEDADEVAPPQRSRRRGDAARRRPA
jgi:hypothetical protein